MIRTIETRLYRVPPHRKILDAIQEFEAMELITASVTADDGTTGLGFTYTIGRGGSAVKRFLDDALMPFYLGGDENAPERLWRGRVEGAPLGRAARHLLPCHRSPRYRGA